MAVNNEHSEELVAAIRTIQDRVRARHPEGSIGGTEVPVPDLLPIVHARDAAEAKVAAIGSVNPRAPGLVNAIIQAVKRQVSRALDWHVREQVEFNRSAMACVEAILQTFNETNLAMIALANDFAVRADQARNELDAARREVRNELDEVRNALDAARRDAAELRDIRTHWIEWRNGWEKKLSTNEIQFLRSVADLQIAFQHRVTLMESNFRDMLKSQHADYLGALDRSTIDIQKRLWDDLERIRIEYERLIHNELRVIRQKASAKIAEPAGQPAPSSSGEAMPVIDYLRFADRFRGSFEYVKEKQAFYRPYFEGRKQVLDIGSGRGEFLELMKESGVPARGIDLSDEEVALCIARGCAAEKADLFPYLGNLPEGALDGIFCAQVVEHLTPAQLPEMVRLAAHSLAPGGVLAIETPNPECLAIFATHFYLDPTHVRPIPPALLVFYLEEAGFGNIEVHRLSPAIESMPSLGELPEEFRKTFFGGLDYAVIGRKL